MDVIWFIAGLLIGAIVGVLVGYCAACLSILRKTSVREWERDHQHYTNRVTCRNVADSCDGSIFECSNCHERWELTCGSPEENHLFFCPRCGSKVVDDGDDNEPNE